MAPRRTLNPRRLTKKQVKEIVTGGATMRTDLMKSFEETYASGIVNRPLVYELEGDRFLFVFDENGVSFPGKGDIYPGDFFRRFARWTERVRDTALGSMSSVSHWLRYSRWKDQLPTAVDRLVGEFKQVIDQGGEALDFSYASLDRASRHVETIGTEAASENLYDHLVVYVGEVIRRRTKGVWRVLDIDSSSGAYPYIAAPGHDVIMPINVVWDQLGSFEPVDLRKAVANEVRRARARGESLNSQLDRTS